jgi:uncharacterized protein (UPF0335 family)
MALARSSMEGKAEQFVRRIEALISELETEKGEYMARCKERREDIKEIYTEADESGVPRRALRGIVKFRELDRKQKAIASGLDIDEQSAYRQLVEALGPLGQAAAEKAGFTAEPPAKGERPDADNLEHVGRGKIGTAQPSARIVN